VLLFVRLTSKASRNAIGDVVEDANHQTWLKVYVTVVPEGGKANDALIQVLAKKWKIPSSRIQLIAGHTDRSKILKIHCPYEEIFSLLPEL
jgi:uncharacterized protein YggU (UPF0235/DUF167 family)